MSFYRAALMGLGLTLSATAFAGATASSFQKENRKGANYWNAVSALDGKLETCWRVPGESSNTGEWLQVDLPKSGVAGISMVNGWGKDTDTYKDFARIKQVRVDVMKMSESFDLELVGSETIDFVDQDEPSMQTVMLPNIIEIDSDAGGAVKLTVTEVYAGVDFPSLAMSEIIVELDESKLSPPAAFTVLGASSNEGDSLKMEDGNARTAWVGDTKTEDAPAWITVQATGFGMSKIGLQRLSTSYDRPKKVKIKVGTKEVVVDVADSKDMQWLEVPSTFGYSGSTLGDITLEVVDVYPGSSNAGKLGIAEITAKATQFDALTF